MAIVATGMAMGTARAMITTEAPCCRSAGGAGTQLIQNLAIANMGGLARPVSLRLTPQLLGLRQRNPASV